MLVVFFLVNFYGGGLHACHLTSLHNPLSSLMCKALTTVFPVVLYPGSVAVPIKPHHPYSSTPHVPRNILPPHTLSASHHHQHLVHYCTLLTHHQVMPLWPLWSHWWASSQMLQEIIDILVASFTALNQPLAEVVLQNRPTLNLITTDKGRISVFFICISWKQCC